LLLRSVAQSMNYSGGGASDTGFMETFAAVTQAVRTATRQSTSSSSSSHLVLALLLLTQFLVHVTPAFYGDNMWLEPDVPPPSQNATGPQLSSFLLFTFYFFFCGNDQMEEILSGNAAPAAAADHTPLATSLGDFEVLGGELGAEGKVTAFPRFRFPLSLSLFLLRPALWLQVAGLTVALVAAAAAATDEEEVDIPRGERKAPLSPQEWQSFFDESGRITNERKLRKKIFYGVWAPLFARFQRKADSLDIE
jgi:hypothetical protein